jgi:hypothetical protein
MFVREYTVCVCANPTPRDSSRRGRFRERFADNPELSTWVTRKPRRHSLTAPDSDAILIALFRGPGGHIRASSGSGAQPAWAHDGRRLFYVAPDRKLMMVEFDPRAKSAAAPRVLFQSRIRSDSGLAAYAYLCQSFA